MTSRTLFTNAASLILGRIALSVGRFVAVLLVARLTGAETYGAYAIVLGVLFLAEWLADFGHTDIAIRDASRSSGAGSLASLKRLKLLSGPIAAMAMIAILIAGGYPQAMILAGAAGCVSVLISAAIQVPRAQLRLEGRQHLDVLAEIAGLIVTLAVLAALLSAQAPLWALIAAFAVGRVVQGVVLIFQVGSAFMGTDLAAPLMPLVRSSFPLGVIGLIVMVYELAAPIILSKLTDMSQVGYFMAAFRLVAPTLIITQSVAQAFFPLLSARWGTDDAQFIMGQEAVIYMSALLAAGMAAAAFGGAQFLMGLFGPDFAENYRVLQVLSGVVFLRAINTAVAPVIIIVNRQSAALWLAVTALVAQFALLAFLVPALGLLGAALAYLIVELLISTIATWHFARNALKMPLGWQVPARFGLALGLAGSSWLMLDLGYGLAGLVMCPALMVAIALVLGLGTSQRFDRLRHVFAMRAAVQ